MSQLARSGPPPKRARSSREPYRPPRETKELVKAVGAGVCVVVLSLGAVLFLGRDHLGNDSTAPVSTVTTIPSGTPATPPSAVPGTSAPAGTPPASSAPAGRETPPPTSAPSASTTLPGAPKP